MLPYVNTRVEGRDCGRDPAGVQITKKKEKARRRTRKNRGVSQAVKDTREEAAMKE